MWVERLDVGGFRCLRRSISLARGLTVVTGPNESGKSTLHELLARMLFGFSPSERRRAGGESHKDRCRPWGGGQFGAVAVVNDVRGRALVVDWDFEQHSVSVRDRDTGEDLSAQVRGKREDVTLGRFLLGIELDEFRDVCCLHQRMIEPVRGSEPLKILLQRSIESGSSGVRVEDADARLADFLRDPLGVHTAYYTPRRGGPLDTLRTSRDELTRELDSCEQGREEIGKMAAQLTEATGERERVARELERARQGLLLTEWRGLEARLAKGRELAHRSTHRPSDPLSLPGTIVQQVRDARQRIARLSDEIRGLAPQARERRADVGALRARQLELRREADALAADRDVDASAEDRVRELIGRLEASGGGERPSVPARDPRLERFRRERARLLELAGADLAVRPSTRELAVAGLIAVLSIAAGALVHPLAFVGLLVAALVLILARRPDDRLRQGLERTLAELGAESLDALDAQAAREDRDVAEAEERLRRWEQDFELRADAERELAELLDEAGAPERGQIHERTSIYLAGCARHRRLLELEAEHGHLSGQIAKKEEVPRELERREAEVADARRELGGAYARVGITAEDPDEASREYDLLAERASADALTLTEADDAARQLAVLLEGMSLDDLQQRTEQARQRHREHTARHGSLLDEPADPERLRESVNGLDSQLRELERACEGLSARIDERESQLPDPAELRRRLGEVTAQIDSMERAARAIRIARDELAESAREAHRVFAPHLRKALERNLPRITGGRYSRATIDEDLQIQLVAPETAGLVRAEVLSRGTQDQIFLLERLEIARLLDPTTGEAPLLLDDPFDHFDDLRLRHGLELLAEVAEERQVVLFAEESDVVHRVQEVCGECQVIQLPGPDERSEARAA